MIVLATCCCVQLMSGIGLVLHRKYFFWNRIEKKYLSGSLRFLIGQLLIIIFSILSLIMTSIALLTTVYNDDNLGAY